MSVNSWGYCKYKGDEFLTGGLQKVLNSLPLKEILRGTSHVQKPLPVSHCHRILEFISGF